MVLLTFFSLGLLNQSKCFLHLAKSYHLASQRVLDAIYNLLFNFTIFTTPFIVLKYITDCNTVHQYDIHWYTAMANSNEYSQSA